MRTKTALSALALSLSVLASPTVAHGAPVASCPSDYTPLDQEQVAALPDADLA
jgi:hypothetical protein